MAAIEQTAQRAQRLTGRTVVITGSSSDIDRVPVTSEVSDEPDTRQ
jgi:hypothetical protein